MKPIKNYNNLYKTYKTYITHIKIYIQHINTYIKPIKTYLKPIQTYIKHIKTNIKHINIYIKPIKTCFCSNNSLTKLHKPLSMVLYRAIQYSTLLQKSFSVCLSTCIAAAELRDGSSPTSGTRHFPRLVQHYDRAFDSDLKCI